jgi:hypothetical protein
MQLEGLLRRWFQSKTQKPGRKSMDAKGYVGRNPSFGLARESSNPNATVFPAGGAIWTGEASAGFVFYFGK